MHDLHFAQQILKTVLGYAEKSGFKNVSKVRIELGSLVEHGEEISEDNLCHNFKLLAKDTIAKDAKLKIKKITRLPAGRKGDSWKLLDIEGSM